MAEKCYRSLQDQGEIGGMSLIELLVLMAVPIALIPTFTLFDINFLFILAIESLLFAAIRIGNKVSPFRFGMLSFICFHFIWPKNLSAFQLQEVDYFLKDRTNEAVRQRKK